jgi:hypothetical protein
VAVGSWIERDFERGLSIELGLVGEDQQQHGVTGNQPAEKNELRGLLKLKLFLNFLNYFYYRYQMYISSSSNRVKIFFFFFLYSFIFILESIDVPGGEKSSSAETATVLEEVGV